MDPFVVDKHNLCGEDAVISGIDSGVEFVLTPEPPGNYSVLDCPALTGEGLERMHTYDSSQPRKKANRGKWGSWGGPSSPSSLHPPSKTTEKHLRKPLKTSQSNVKITFSPVKRPQLQRRKSFLVKPKVVVPPPDFIQENIDSIKMICKKPELESHFSPQIKTVNSENSQDDELRRNKSMMRSYDMGEISEDMEFFTDVKVTSKRRQSQLEIRYKELMSLLSPTEAPKPEPPPPSPPKPETPPPQPLRNHVRSRTVSGIDLFSQKMVGKKAENIRSGSKRQTRREESSRSVLTRIQKMRSILGKPSEIPSKPLQIRVLSPRHGPEKWENKAEAGGMKTGKYHHKHTLSLPVGMQGNSGAMTTKSFVSTSQRVIGKSQSTLKRGKASSRPTELDCNQLFR